MIKPTHKLSEKQWQEKLSSEQYYVCRQKGTEPAFQNQYYNHKEEGIYQCVCCKASLFGSEDKYDSKSGWPSFTKPIDSKNIEELPDYSLGSTRTEVLCSTCGAHLGHVFPDGPPPKGLRYCINSTSLHFEKKHS